MTLNSKKTLFSLLLLSFALSNLWATTAIIDCPTRKDFEACYLTTENPLEQNLATLLKGLEVEVIGRSDNGRWKVRLLEVRASKVVPHGSWPNGGPAEGWVNACFLVMDKFGSAEEVLTGAGDSEPATGEDNGGLMSVDPSYSEPNSSSQDEGNQEPAGDIGLLGMSTGVDGTSEEDDLMCSEPPAVDNEGEDSSSTGPLTGSEFIRRTASLSRPERERAILQAIQAGNVPSFLKKFVAIKLENTGPSGQKHEATIMVSPDYVAIGTDEDFIRIPMAAPTAQTVAELYGCTLPRAKLVDAIWKQATYKLQPRPLPPTSQMMSNEWYKRANELIDKEMGSRPVGPLTAGDKKDVVLTNRLLQKKDRVAIYGWHQTNGKAIQPLSTIHEASYADYSHGLRLVSTSIIVDGKSMKVSDVLKDSELSGLLTHEKNIQVMRYP